MGTNQLKLSARLLLAAILLMPLGAESFGSDRDKAETRLRIISAMTVDSTARAIVNQTMAEVVHAKRIELMRQRHAMNLDYGSLFLAHQLKAEGAAMLDIAIELQSGKGVVQIADERQVNWKLVANAAKQLNEKIEDNIYRHFQRVATETQIAAGEKYDPDKDIVRADLSVTPGEAATARADYALWRDRASAPNSGRLDSRTESLLGKSADVYHGEERPHPF
jgi:hypothetical protein